MLKSRHVHFGRVEFMDDSNIRVRFAPSPTGIPHVGNIRTALFDYFFAKANQGTFILRIEDTDQARKVEGAESSIKESLKWLGAEWDEFVVQSERLSEYKKYAEELVSKGLAREDEGAIRFNVQKSGDKISWTDAVGNKEISYNSDDIEDFIILKKDGFPTYHLANVVDDHLMDITHVIRGEDWIPSTPKHILLYKAFGWEAPIFAHVPNVLGADRKKLSKRHGAKTVLEFKNEGYLSEALLNYLMLLGFSPKDDREILSKEDFEKEFDLSKVNTAPAIFDNQKLLWMNGVYIREKISSDELMKMLLDFDAELKSFDESTFSGLVEIAKTRGNTLAEISNLVKQVLNKKNIELSSEESELKKRIIDELNNIGESEWNTQNLSEKLVQKFVMNEKIKYSKIYYVLLGIERWLPLADTFSVLGKNKTLELIS